MLVGVIDGARIMTIRDPALDGAGTLTLLRTLIARFLAPPKT